MINKKIKEDDYQSLFPFIESNIYFRKGLIRLFVNQCGKTNVEVFNNIQDEEEKEIILDNIVELKQYERFLRVHREIEPIKFKRKIKRGNR